MQSQIYKEGLYHDCDESITEMAKLLLSHETAESGITVQLTDQNYGSVSRFYIECNEDKAVTLYSAKNVY